MTGLPERDLAASLEEKSEHIRSSKISLLSSLLASTFSICESHPDSSSCERKVNKSTSYGWTAAVKKVLTVSSMRRFQERLLGTSKTDISSSTSDIWLLGSCYKVLREDASNTGNGLDEFLQDFSSRIWITYRKGFGAIPESKLTSDANWGCMIRSSQMLVAQALLFHRLGRSWRKSAQKPYNPEYVEILHLFGDTEACAFSIHNLLQAGRDYGLVAGSWLGPYAMCRTWETLARTHRERADFVNGNETLPMAVYIVSGDEDGERGGAPVVCIDTAASLSSDFSKGKSTWAPILLLVPLVLGLEKINPRYVPLLLETFTFPQSLGILGGKPGASTYIVGVQDDKALYLDPHEIQPVVHIKSDDLEADTSSYHCSTIRHMQLELIDSSLAIGFYCRDEDDFKDFCSRASKLGDISNGAPLFTVTQSLRHISSIHHEDGLHGTYDNVGGDAFGVDHLSDNDGLANEDDWQIL